MKIKYSIVSLCFLLVTVLNSCYSPQNIIKLEPQEKSDRWRFGQQLISDTLYGISYEVGFARCQEGKYWFDVSISNRSNLPITIKPENFKIEIIDGSDNVIQKVTALDPEKEILQIEKELSRNEAVEKNAFGASLVALGVDVATAVITATDDNPRNDYLCTNMFGVVQGALAENAYETDNLINLHEVWSNGMLRKTTLDPNYQINGMVLFPFYPEADYLKLYLPVDNQYVEVLYKQVQIPVE